ncbi:MAG: hypothetical protein QQN46_08110 [Nitrosopumilus sp.]
MYQGVAESGQRQHGAIPRSLAPVVSRHRAAQLCRSSGGGPGTVGWQAASSA